MALPRMASSFLPFAVLLLISLLPWTAFSEGPAADPELVVAVEDLPPPSPPLQCPDHSASLQELDRTRAQLRDLEKSLSNKDLALKERGNVISALQTQLEILKKKENSDNENMLKELSSKVARLEDSLRRKDADLKSFKEKVKSLQSSEDQNSAKIKQLEKVVADQKSKIEKAEKALRVAESTLTRVQQEADAKERELRKVHSGWLPPWAVNKYSELQEITGVYWSTYGQPLVDSTTVMVSEKASAIWKSSKPHVDSFSAHVQQNWTPVIKEHFESLSSAIAPHIETAKAKISENYEAARDIIKPELEKAHDFVKPHIDVLKDTCRPYVEQVASILRPYYEQVKTITKPYRRKLFKIYREFLTSATSYHTQLQGSLQESLKKVEILSPLASNELVWFLASAMLLFPVMVLSVFLSSTLSPKKKPVKTSKGHGNHAHRRPKRSKQADR